MKCDAFFEKSFLETIEFQMETSASKCSSLKVAHNNIIEACFHKSKHQLL